MTNGHINICDTIITHRGNVWLPMIQILSAFRGVVSSGAVLLHVEKHFNDSPETTTVAFHNPMVHYTKELLTKTVAFDFVIKQKQSENL